MMVNGKITEHFTCKRDKIAKLYKTKLDFFKDTGNSRMTERGTGAWKGP